MPEENKIWKIKNTTAQIPEGMQLGRSLNNTWPVQYERFTFLDSAGTKNSIRDHCFVKYVIIPAKMNDANLPLFLSPHSNL